MFKDLFSEVFKMYALERWFFVKAKTFALSMVEGASVLRLEERRNGFSGVVFLGNLFVAGLVSELEKLSRLSENTEFVNSFREGPKVFIILKGGNNSDRFLEVAVYEVGGRRGLILILEGRKGGDGVVLLLSWVRCRNYLKPQSGLGLVSLLRWC